MNKEVRITREIYEDISKLDLSSLKKISKKRSVTTTEFKAAVKDWFGQKIPWPLVEPDLILVFEDYRNIIDDVMIAAIEIKYFEQGEDLDKRMRQSFRELGQPLRNLVFGFDSAVLWHIFSTDIEEQKIDSYINIVEEVIQRLKLPIVYLATAIPYEEFKIHKPFKLDKYDLGSLVGWIMNLCADCRNPVADGEVKIRRSGLKMALRIPT